MTIGTKKLTRDEVWWSVTSILHFDTPEIRENLVDALIAGKSVVLDALSYIGNGKWVSPKKQGRYKYKMIVPIATNLDVLYSTDLFVDLEDATRGKYGVYSHTRQMAVKIVLLLYTDYEIERFDFGYKDGSYGIYSLETNNEKTLI